MFSAPPAEALISSVMVDQQFFVFMNTKIEISARISRPRHHGEDRSGPKADKFG